MADDDNVIDAEDVWETPSASGDGFTPPDRHRPWDDPDWWKVTPRDWLGVVAWGMGGALLGALAYWLVFWVVIPPPTGP